MNDKDYFHRIYRMEKKINELLEYINELELKVHQIKNSFDVTMYELGKERNNKGVKK